ncbi:MAG: hypothetical protein NTY83_04250 [Candidatus Micrarchaeota archaeon]|nr:hypothetical protein [Candidatus Micrarchaeota archaeon]
MVGGSGNGNGKKPQLRLINGDLAEKPPTKTDPPKKFAHLAGEVEPIVQDMLGETRQLVDAREKINRLCLIALIRAEVDGDAMPMLREAAVAADAQKDRLLAAELMVQVADAFRMSGLGPWPIMDMAFNCAIEAQNGGEKEEILAGIAYSYAVLGDYPRAERIMEMLTEFELRKSLKGAIEELICSQEAGE